VNPLDLPVYASALPPPGDLSKPEIELVQSRLREMGYHTVGKVDGRWGPSTTGAIASLQAQAGIPVTGQYDEATREAMKSEKNRREISPERASVTVNELRAEGSKTIKAADKVSIGSLLLTCLSGAIALVTFVANHWEEASKMADSVRPLLEWIPTWAWPAVVAVVGLFLSIKAGTIKQARVEAERTGLHNGEPSSGPITVEPADS